MSEEPDSAWPRARELAALVGLRLAACGFAWGIGFRALSDDDYSRLVIAERFAQSPSLDPSGTSWLPLPFWVYGGALRLFGMSLSVARATAIVSSVLATIALYVAARWLGASRAGALLGAALACLLEYSLLLGLATVPEVPCAALILLGVASLAGHDPSRRLVGATALLAACACRYEAWPVAAAFAVFSLRDALRGRRELWPAALVALAFPLLWLTHGALHHGSALFFVSRVTAYRQALGQAPDPLWRRLGEYPARFLWAPGMIVCLAFLAVVSRRLTRALPRPPLWAAAALLAFLIAGSVSDGVPTHHAERVLLPLWSLTVLLTADAVAQLWSRARSVLRAATAVILLGMSARALMLARSTTLTLQSRNEELAIGALARNAGADRLVVDTPDYGFFAVIASFGDPAHAAPIDDRDPRRARIPDPFADPETFDAFLAETRPRWLVVARAHAPLAVARCPQSAQTTRFVLARCEQR